MMKRYHILLCAVAWAPLPNAAHTQTPTQSTIAVNQVKALIRSDGTAFDNGQQGVFVPLQPGLAQKTLLRNAGIWLAGVDPAFNLRGSVQVTSQTDFHAGGLDESGLPNNLNEVWKVSCADINQHLADWQDDGLVNNPNSNVYAFPCGGNSFFEQYNAPLTLPSTAQGSAGFFDRNQNAAYEPQNGEYPSIQVRGCSEDAFPEEQNWFVFNDFTIHPSKMAPIGMEVQSQFFAYKTPTASILNNTVFARYKLINRSNERIDSCFLGVYADFDIGNPDDDFLGSIPDRNILYGYNGDPNDAGGFGTEIPVMAMDLLRGPINELGEALGLHSILVLDNTDNLSPLQYYGLLTGRLKDGSPAPYGGIMYPGNPNDPNGISELTAGNTPGRRVGLASFGPFQLLPGAVNEIIIAFYYVHTPGATPLQNVQTLYAQSNEIQNLFDNCFKGLDNSCDATSAAPVPTAQLTGLHISPNPAVEAFVLESKGEPFNRIQMTDMLGRTVRSIELEQPVDRHIVQVGDLQAGVYLVRAGGQVIPVVVQ